MKPILCTSLESPQKSSDVQAFFDILVVPGYKSQPFKSENVAIPSVGGSMSPPSSRRFSFLTLSHSLPDFPGCGLSLATFSELLAFLFIVGRCICNTNKTFNIKSWTKKPWTLSPKFTTEYLEGLITNLYTNLLYSSLQTKTDFQILFLTL